MYDKGVNQARRTIGTPWLSARLARCYLYRKCIAGFFISSNLRRLHHLTHFMGNATIAPLVNRLSAAYVWEADWLPDSSS